MDGDGIVLKPTLILIQPLKISYAKSNMAYHFHGLSFSILLLEPVCVFIFTVELEFPLDSMQLGLAFLLNLSYNQSI